MRLILLLAAAAALSSCATPAKPVVHALPAEEEAVTKPARPSSWKEIEEALDRAEPTAEEKALSSSIGREYFLALRATIEELDDSTSSAEIVARAAVNRHLPLLRKKFFAQVSHIARSSDFAEQQAQESALRIPSRSDIDVAVEMVLRLRKQRLDPAGEIRGQEVGGGSGHSQS